MAKLCDNRAANGLREAAVRQHEVSCKRRGERRCLQCSRLYAQKSEELLSERVRVTRICAHPAQQRVGHRRFAVAARSLDDGEFVGSYVSYATRSRVPLQRRQEIVS